MQQLLHAWCHLQLLTNDEIWICEEKDNQQCEVSFVFGERFGERKHMIRTYARSLAYCSLNTLYLVNVLKPESIQIFAVRYEISLCFKKHEPEGKYGDKQRTNLAPYHQDSKDCQNRISGQINANPIAQDVLQHVYRYAWMETSKKPSFSPIVQ